MLLVMGLSEQMITWPDGFCAALAARSFHVIRFDNRDIGLSIWLDHLGDVNVPALFTGDMSSGRYGLSDMAADTAGLIEALGVRRAHLVGVSMGGTTAQLVAPSGPTSSPVSPQSRRPPATARSGRPPSTTSLS
ncbi:alpha/beta fold hydrolase [Micromonospora sp. PTRAS2]